MTMGLTCKEKRRNAKGFKRRIRFPAGSASAAFGAGHHSSRPAAGQAVREKKALVLGKTGVLSCTFARVRIPGAAPEKSFRFKEKTVTSNIGVLIGVIVVLLMVAGVVLMMVMEWSKPEAPAELAEASAPARSGRPGLSRGTAAPKKKAVPKSKKKAAKKAPPAAKKKTAKKPKKK
jgi:hypothetical protein